MEKTSRMSNKTCLKKRKYFNKVKITDLNSPWLPSLLGLDDMECTVGSVEMGKITRIILFSDPYLSLDCAVFSPKNPRKGIVYVYNRGSRMGKTLQAELVLLGIFVQTPTEAEWKTHLSYIPKIKCDKEIRYDTKG